MGYGSKDMIDRMDETIAIVRNSGFDEKPPVPTLVALLHSECAELFEAWRKGRLDQPSDHADAMKAANCQVMTCGAEEIADIIIRALHTAWAIGVNPEYAVRDKLAFNATRDFRHGSKLA